MILKEDILNYLILNKEYFSEKFNITKIGIFGSFAGNEQTDKSDIDIIFELKIGTDDVYEIKNELKQILKRQFKKDIDLCREKAIKPLFRDVILREVIYV